VASSAGFRLVAVGTRPLIKRSEQGPVMTRAFLFISHALRVLCSCRSFGRLQTMQSGRLQHRDGRIHAALVYRPFQHVQRLGQKRAKSVALCLPKSWRRELSGLEAGIVITPCAHGLARNPQLLRGLGYRRSGRQQLGTYRS
jgi:hypothetical protein